MAFPSWKNRRRVALVRLDNLPAGKLSIRVSRPNNLSAALVDHRQGREPIVRTELIAPAGGDGVGAALRRPAVGMGGRAARYNVGAGGGARWGLDAEGPGTFGVSGIADTLHALDGPLGVGNHHRLG